MKPAPKLEEKEFGDHPDDEDEVRREVRGRRIVRDYRWLNKVLDESPLEAFRKKYLAKGSNAEAHQDVATTNATHESAQILPFARAGPEVGASKMMDMAMLLQLQEGSSGLDSVS